MLQKMFSAGPAAGSSAPAGAPSSTSAVSSSTAAQTTASTSWSGLFWKFVTLHAQSIGTSVENAASAIAADATQLDSLLSTLTTEINAVKEEIAAKTASP